MNRRDVLKASISCALLQFGAGVPAKAATPAAAFSRVRPGMPGWPDADKWERLRAATGGRLAALSSPFDACGQHDADAPACKALLHDLQDPFFIGDQPALTQSSGWQDAWVSRPSA